MRDSMPAVSRAAADRCIPRISADHIPITS
jgi:hypothetical protein